MTEKKIDGFDEFEVEGAVRNLIEAEVVKQDPKLFGAAKKKILKQKKAINSVEGLRQARNDKFQQESKEEEKAS